MIRKSTAFRIALLAAMVILTSMVLVQAAPITIDENKAVAAPDYSSNDYPSDYNTDGVIFDYNYTDELVGA
ncbi:hypothetical protein BGZ97_003521, partial [Linnemannia gamsii]